MSILAAGSVLVVQGCGSSSSSGNSTALCEQACVKVQMCLADASASSAMTSCTASCSAGAAGASGHAATCTNQSAIDSASQNCLAMSDCTKFEACALTVPKCQTSTGTGGTTGTGTGGTTGTGTGGANGAAGNGGGTGGTSGAGGAGAASCSICDKAQTCCVAAESKGIPASLCTFSASSCNAMSATAQSTQVTECQAILTEGAGVGVSACQ